MLDSAATSGPGSSCSAIYRPRRPAQSILHKIVRENLETYLSATQADSDFSTQVPPHIESALREYLKCGILAHGFARAYCAGCGYDFLIAFSCKGRDICPSCSTRRMVETAAHMVDSVLPRVQFRQWVLSVPKRVRWHMFHKPEVTNGLLRVFLRAMDTTVRQRSPDAPADARFGAVAFVHRFGSTLNSHVHYHVLVSDGVFSAGDDGEAVFHPALDLDDADFLAAQTKMRKRDLRWLQRHGLERLVRYCARPPMSQERLGRLNDKQLVYHLRKPTVDGRTELILTPLELLDRLSKLITPPRIHKHRYCGVLAPNAKLRRAVIESAGPAGSIQLRLDEAREMTGLFERADETEPSSLRKAVVRCWALLFVRIYG